MLLHCPDTLFVGKNWLERPGLPSTNGYALTLLSKNKPVEGTVVCTPHQYAGKGLRGNSWESEAGKNITLSIVLYPTFLPADRQALLNQCIALSVFDVVEKYFPGCTKIKWPNDIYIRDKKVAGILIQNALSGAVIRSSVAGIGINVNQQVFPSSLPNPTSFQLETGSHADIGRLRCQLCQCVERRYLQLKSGNLVPLHQAYLDHLYLYRTEALFQKTDGEVFRGSITGVDQAGRLVIDSEGKTTAFGLKQIRFLPNQPT